MAVAPHEVVTSKGDAVGKLTAFSHVVMVCRDMDATVRFYRDILGLNVVFTSGEEAIQARDQRDANDPRFAGETIKRAFTRQYFFELPSGEAFGFYEVPDNAEGRESGPAGHPYWPGAADAPTRRPQRFHHLAFNVETSEDVDWFVNRLTEHGIEFTGPFGAPGDPFMSRIYFWDPSGYPLEIATIGMADERSAYLTDTNPVPALLER